LRAVGELAVEARAKRDIVGETKFGADAMLLPRRLKPEGIDMTMDPCRGVFIQVIEL
jgi:hypothetical protein